MRKGVLTIIILGTMLAGCKKQQGPADLPAPPADTYSGDNALSPTATAVTPGSHADFLATVVSNHILFDTDEYDVDEDDKQILQSQAQWLLRYPQKRVTIEGHCDERGTREYNLALGERRANAAKNYLAALGIDPARVSTISYGKERPVSAESSEAGWAQNRRAVTVTID